MISNSVIITRRETVESKMDLDVLLIAWTYDHK